MLILEGGNPAEKENKNLVIRDSFRTTNLFHYVFII